MIQAIIKNGKVFAEEIPTPNVSAGSVLIKVVSSCISSGTELSGVNSSKSSYIKKALQQPEKVIQFFQTSRNEEISKVIKKIEVKKNMEAPTGYSLAGIVIGVGEGTTKFKLGDHVAAVGAGIANHAEFVDVPENLTIMIPDSSLSFEAASTAALGGIALQSIRRADLKIGEYCSVIGTGVIGLLTVQLLNRAGIRTIAIDINNERLQLAKKYGAEYTINPLENDPIAAVSNYTGGYGADGVIFCAYARGDEPISQAFKMCKRKGKVVLVGVTGMNINRDDMYVKEIDFLISTSYGPGRYDSNYEMKGLDYPYAYVRWTENRNIEEYLRLLGNKSVIIDEIIKEQISILDVEKAFDKLQGADKPLTIILEYPKMENFENESIKRRINVITDKKHVPSGVINTAVVGTGNFASEVHLPNLFYLKDKFRIYAIGDRKGLKSKFLAKQYNSEYAFTDYGSMLSDPNISLVFICTNHASHAELVLSALKAGKHVFVEKPLAVSFEQLNQLREFYNDRNDPLKPKLIVGFNRRYSPCINEIKKYTDARINPLFVTYNMNAGYLPAEHWTQAEGGRIIGEACHIIDLMSCLTGSSISEACSNSLSPANEKFFSSDNKSIILKYRDGSICNINYFAVGGKTWQKEYMQIHFDEKTIIMSDYKQLSGYGFNLKKYETAQSDKGHKNELLHLYNYINSPSINYEMLESNFETTEISIKVSD